MELHHTIILHNQVWVDKSENLIANFITYISDKTWMIKQICINQCKLYFSLLDRPCLVYKLGYFYLAVLHYNNKCMKMYMF